MVEENIWVRGSGKSPQGRNNAPSSRELIKKYANLHKRSRYGISSELRGNHKLIQDEIDHVQANRVLDYGCGQSNLKNLVSVQEFVRYDPALPEYSKKPSGNFDLVICTDVLEHILEDDLDGLICHINSYSDNVFYAIAFTPAGKFPDGTPYHVTLHSPQWWEAFLGQYYKSVEQTLYGGRGRAVGGFRCSNK